MMIHSYIIWTVAVIAILLMFRYSNSKMWDYKCPQCGASSNEQHAEHCSFKEKF